MSPRPSDRWRILRSLLDQVLELSPAARAAWLTELRHADPALAADLESLLGSEPELDRTGFLGEAGRRSLQQFFPPELRDTGPQGAGPDGESP